MVRLHIPHMAEGTKYTLFSCRYWPEIWRKEVKGKLKERTMVRPTKIPSLIELKKDVYTKQDLEVNLVTDLISGPFNYGKPRDYNNRYYQVPDEAWLELTTKGASFQIDIDMINKK